ncbi:hypothetical protein EVAR_20202_1 [Eumeta japonica]|uniref:Uncharacterized protein n=1 Tax=Eumeta variegata TaxID=151549 RepID=A0A4C1UV58_EUMVA|nr:hypothetical protein EVAR_20202_1 [Eumeta japonica]
MPLQLRCLQFMSAPRGSTSRRSLAIWNQILDRFVRCSALRTAIGRTWYFGVLNAQMDELNEHTIERPAGRRLNTRRNRQSRRHGPSDEALVDTLDHIWNWSNTTSRNRGPGRS